MICSAAAALSRMESDGNSIWLRFNAKAERERERDREREHGVFCAMIDSGMIVSWFLLAQDSDE